MNLTSLPSTNNICLDSLQLQWATGQSLFTISELISATRSKMFLCIWEKKSFQIHIVFAQVKDKFVSTHKTKSGKSINCKITEYTHLPSLLISKDEVYPAMQIFRNIICFQSFPVLPYELSSTAFGPRGQNYVTNLRKNFF